MSIYIVRTKLIIRTYLNAFGRNGHVRNVIVVNLGDGLVNAAPLPILDDGALEAFLVND